METMMAPKTLPTLYKKTSTGALQFWEISVLGNVITTRYGQQGGKVQEASDTIKEGKSKGKKNETTPEQQALLEAEAKWTKQKKKGYVETPSDALSGQVDTTVIEGGISPMLAHKFTEQGHKIKYPAYVQPKLDGVRCVAIVQDGKATLWTRTRKPIVAVPHIQRELEAAFPTGVHHLDGELYNHELNEEFEKIISAVRKEKADSIDPASAGLIQYHIYDHITDDPFWLRARALYDKFPKQTTHLHFVETVEALTEDAVDELFEKYTALGYEGVMVRNAEGLYVNKRSYDLLKLKEFDEAEFKIVGAREGRGKMAGKAVFTCLADNGNEFDVKMKGKLEDLKQYLDDPTTWQGKKLTVQYFGLTSANKVPRFPVGKAVRDYE